LLPFVGVLSQRPACRPQLLIGERAADLYPTDLYPTDLYPTDLYADLTLCVTDGHPDGQAMMPVASSYAYLLNESLVAAGLLGGERTAVHARLQAGRPTRLATRHSAPRSTSIFHFSPRAFAASFWATMPP
jgi:hypothetical protein